MSVLGQADASHEVAVEIGGVPILLRTSDSAFRDLLEHRYAGFVNPAARPRADFEVELEMPRHATDQDIEVRLEHGRWSLRRGDFRAVWDPQTGTGRVLQSRNPYAIDSVLRIVHSLILVREGGFLLHSASVIRDGHAFLFAGISGAGKTTISRLAPSDVTLLTDEVSYVRREADGYQACGTPFAGELARAGENCSAPIKTLFFLEQGSDNRIESIENKEAARRLLRNILFFAHDPELVRLVFHAALEFIAQVPARRLIFFPDEQVWQRVV